MRRALYPKPADAAPYKRDLESSLTPRHTFGASSAHAERGNCGGLVSPPFYSRDVGHVTSEQVTSVVCSAGPASGAGVAKAREIPAHPVSSQARDRGQAFSLHRWPAPTPHWIEYANSAQCAFVVLVFVLAMATGAFLAPLLFNPVFGG